MATFLIIHTPDPAVDDEVAPPSDLIGLARNSLSEDSPAHWLRAWSPAVDDDRIFTLWSADDAEDVLRILEQFKFLDTMISEVVPVQSWDPESVLLANEVARSESEEGQ